MELVSKRDLADVTVHTQTVDLGEGTKEVELYIDRRDLTDAKVAVACQLFICVDGQSWRPWGGFGTCGGEAQDADTGIVSTRSGMTIQVPAAVKGTARKLMATITVIGTGKTSLEVEER